MFHKGQEIGPYTLIRKLGRGGFGEVWLAERKSKFVTTKVAVKLPLEEDVDPDAIRKEATLWEKGSGHPNVVSIIDADDYDGQIVIVSEFAADGSLEEWLRDNNNMSIEDAIETTLQILNGLEYLHEREIIHRDLKPANILLQGKIPRLADFGISRALRSTMTSQSQNISGTFAYMAPEAIDGRRSVETDLWSVGVNFYRFLTGVLPFPNKEPSVLIASILTHEHVPLTPFFPQNIHDIIAKALAKLPENRYSSTAEMREDLNRVQNGEDISKVKQSDLPLPTRSFPISIMPPMESPPLTYNHDLYDEQETVVRLTRKFWGNQTLKRFNRWTYGAIVLTITAIGVLTVSLVGIYLNDTNFGSVKDASIEKPPARTQPVENAKNINRNPKPNSTGSSVKSDNLTSDANGIAATRSAKKSQLTETNSKRANLNRLKKYIGKYANHEVLNDTFVRRRLVGLVGRRKYGTIKDYTTVQFGVEMVSGAVVVNGCKPHDCMARTAIVVAVLATNEVHAAILDNEEIVIYSEQKTYRRLPLAVRNWIKDGIKTNREYGIQITARYR